VAIFPITFIANTFVPSEGLPTVLRTIADWNPVSSLTQASRELFGNTTTLSPKPTAWPLQHPVVYTLGWVLLILVVFVPLAVRLYRRAASR
jgi:ABC-2 type transport system permease protein